MWIVYPRKRFSDGIYHLDYGIVGVVVEQFLRWRYAATHVRINVTTEHHTFFPNIVRTEIALDWGAMRGAGTGAFDWYVRLLGWIESPQQSGENVLRALRQIGQQADGFKRTYQKASTAALASSRASGLHADVLAGGVIAFLEGIELGSKLILGVGATVGTGGVAAAAVVGNASLTATELRQKGVSVRCAGLNMAVELTIESVSRLKIAGEGLVIAAKGIDKGVVGYLSGKDLSHAVIEGLVEIAFQAAGSAAEKGARRAQEALFNYLQKARDSWTIPLTSLGPLPEDAVARLTADPEERTARIVRAVVEDGGKFIADYSKSGAARGASRTDIAADRILLAADTRTYENLINQSIYRVS